MLHVSTCTDTFPDPVCLHIDMLAFVAKRCQAAVQTESPAEKSPGCLVAALLLQGRHDLKPLLG